jgi:hypothetical protein
MAVTVGGAVSGAGSVVKLQTRFDARLLPRGPPHPRDSAVYVVLYASAPVGLKVAVFPVIVTAPVTDPPALLRRNVVPFTDAASIASENVAVTFALGSIPVAAFAG